jgi:hypothetical protein
MQCLLSVDLITINASLVLCQARATQTLVHVRPLSPHFDSAYSERERNPMELASCLAAESHQGTVHVTTRDHAVPPCPWHRTLESTYMLP